MHHTPYSQPHDRLIIPILARSGYLRLNTQCLQPHHLLPLPINRNNVVLRPRTLQLHPEHLNLPIPSLLHRINHTLVLRLETLPFDLLDLIPTQQLLQIT